MITQTTTAAFISDMLAGVHDFASDTFKLALYISSADLGFDTQAYATAGETSGFGYTIGGETLTGVNVVNSANGAFIAFDNVVWPLASFTARGALIYNATKSNRAVAVLDFGNDKIATSTFTVQMPPATAASALIRISTGV
jgi:3D (Asp-Asp-Asp) domain-containing protein